MNAVAQALKKQVENLHGEREVREGYIQFLEHHVARLLADLEYTESVGAAFAYDVANETSIPFAADTSEAEVRLDILVELMLNWEDAQMAAKAHFAEVTVDAKTAGEGLASL